MSTRSAALTVLAIVAISIAVGLVQLLRLDAHASRGRSPHP